MAINVSKYLFFFLSLDFFNCTVSELKITVNVLSAYIT